MAPRKNTKGKTTKSSVTKRRAAIYRIQHMASQPRHSTTPRAKARVIALQPNDPRPFCVPQEPVTTREVWTLPNNKAVIDDMSVCNSAAQLVPSLDLNMVDAGQECLRLLHLTGGFHISIPGQDYADAYYKGELGSAQKNFDRLRELFPGLHVSLISGDKIKINTLTKDFNVYTDAKVAILRANRKHELTEKAAAAARKAARNAAATNARAQADENVPTVAGSEANHGNTADDAVPVGETGAQHINMAGG